jgi:hypothetical protein
MKVFVLLEWSGNSHEIDGAFVIGVYSTRDAAEALVSELVTPRRGRDWFEITEHVVDMSWTRVPKPASEQG